jgi:hypothetical protein
VIQNAPSTKSLPISITKLPAGEKNTLQFKWSQFPQKWTKTGCSESLVEPILLDVSWDVTKAGTSLEVNNYDQLQKLSQVIKAESFSQNDTILLFLLLLFLLGWLEDHLDGSIKDCFHILQYKAAGHNERMITAKWAQSRITPLIILTKINRWKCNLKCLNCNKSQRTRRWSF